MSKLYHDSDLVKCDDLVQLRAYVAKCAMQDGYQGRMALLVLDEVLKERQIKHTTLSVYKSMAAHAGRCREQ